MTHSDFVTLVKNGDLFTEVVQDKANTLVFVRPEASEWKSALIFFSVLFWIGTVGGIILLFIYWPIALLILFFCWLPLRTGCKKSVRDAVLKVSLESPSFFEAAIESGTLLVSRRSAVIGGRP